MGYIGWLECQFVLLTLFEYQKSYKPMIELEVLVVIYIGLTGLFS